jgi:hypothetical protein
MGDQLVAKNCAFTPANSPLKLAEDMPIVCELHRLEYISGWNICVFSFVVFIIQFKALDCKYDF